MRYYRQAHSTTVGKFSNVGNDKLYFIDIFLAAKVQTLLDWQSIRNNVIK